MDTFAAIEARPPRTLELSRRRAEEMSPLSGPMSLIELPERRRCVRFVSPLSGLMSLIKLSKNQSSLFSN